MFTEPAQSYKGGGRGNYHAKKNEQFSKKVDMGPLLRLEPRVQAAFAVFFSTANSAYLLERIRGEVP